MLIQKSKLKILMILVFSLTGCNANNENSGLSILTPIGAPSLCFYNQYSKNDFETNSGEVSNILASMINENKDVIVLPTNAGVQAINNKKVNYLLAATITFGNFYIVSTGNDDDGVMNPNDYIVLFQEKQIPDILFHYIYGNAYDSNVHYVGSVQDAAKCFLAGVDLTNNNETVDYVLISEPLITNIKINNKKDIKIYSSIQEEYTKKTNGKSIYQASIFVKNSIDRQRLSNFLNDLETDIKNSLKNVALMRNELSKIENASVMFGIDTKILPYIIGNNVNKMSIGFKNARDNLDEINYYLSLFGSGKINEKDTF